MCSSEKHKTCFFFFIVLFQLDVWNFPAAKYFSCWIWWLKTFANLQLLRHFSVYFLNYRKCIIINVQSWRENIITPYNLKEYAEAMHGERGCVFYTDFIPLDLCFVTVKILFTETYTTLNIFIRTRCWCCYNNDAGVDSFHLWESWISSWCMQGNQGWSHWNLLK